MLLAAQRPPLIGLKQLTYGRLGCAWQKGTEDYRGLLYSDHSLPDYMMIEKTESA